MLPYRRPALRVRLWWLLLLVAWPLWCGAAAPAEPSADRLAVLVVMQGVSWAELAQWDLPTYGPLLREGALGLLQQAGGARGRGANAATISAGRAARGNAYARGASNADAWVNGVTGADLLARYTGVQAHLQAVVHPGMAALRRDEAATGLLGSRLQAAGVQTGAFGNGDDGGVADRAVALIAMNDEGWASFGDVGEDTLRHAPERPGGRRTDYEQVLRGILNQPPGHYFIVVDAGDGVRLQAARPLLTPPQYVALQQAYARECGDFVSRLHNTLTILQRRHRIYLATAAADGDARPMPVLALGDDLTPGLLTSPSTRRPGLVLNIDLTASVLAYFDLAPGAEVAGTPMTVTRAARPAQAVRALDRACAQAHAARLPVLAGYIVILILTLLGSLALALAAPARPAAARWAARLRPLLTAVLLAPAAFLLAPALRLYAAGPCALFVAGVALGGAGLLHALVRQARPRVALAAALVALAYIADQLCGGPLLRDALLSYDVYAGLRFYGLGNESTGVLLAATLLALYAGLESFRRARPLVLILVGLAVTALIGLPAFGADLGGIPAALIGFGVAFGVAHGGGRRLWWGLAVAALLVAAALLAVNVLVAPDQQSHVGHALRQTQTGGAAVLMQAALRKWGMNLALCVHYAWAVLPIALLLGLVAADRRWWAFLRGTLAARPQCRAGLCGIAAMAVAAFLLNDSGLVMAALALAYALGGLLLVSDDAPADRPQPIVEAYAP